MYLNSNVPIREYYENQIFSKIEPKIIKTLQSEYDEAKDEMYVDELNIASENIC